MCVIIIIIIVIMYNMCNNNNVWNNVCVYVCVWKYNNVY
jgi:hypothetical protein